VGYEAFIPLSSYDKLPGKGGECRILVYDHVREDQHVLFGFACEKDREVFTKLLCVSGIGPKLALSALSSLSAREIIAHVAAGDVEVLSTISGVGRKTAERMVVELRKEFAGMAAMDPAATPVSKAGEAVFRDAVQALVALGFKPAEAGRKVSAALVDEKDDISVEALVRKALGR
jgi:Holliday junction DNA helicase RuvA